MKTLGSICGIMLYACLLAQNNDVQTLDHRAAKRYTLEQQQELTPLKIAQINWLYRESFKVNDSKPCAECPSIDVNAFDVSNYQRDMHHPKVIYLTQPGHQVILLPMVEVKRKFKEIADSFENHQPETTR